MLFLELCLRQNPPSTMVLLSTKLDGCFILLTVTCVWVSLHFYFLGANSQRFHGNQTRKEGKSEWNFPSLYFPSKCRVPGWGWPAQPVGIWIWVKEETLPNGLCRRAILARRGATQHPLSTEGRGVNAYILSGRTATFHLPQASSPILSLSPLARTLCHGICSVSLETGQSFLLSWT